jgi:hypothetical protein
MVAGSGQTKIPHESQVPPRVRWKHADRAAEFHRSHGYARYAMDFVATLETEMHDTEVSKEHRVLAAIKRFSWGNFSDFAVTGMPKVAPDDPEPRPITQAELARIIETSAATMSEACTNLRNRSYLRAGVQELYLVDQQAGDLFRSATNLGGSQAVNLKLESNSNSSNGDLPFARFCLAYLDSHPDVAGKINYHQVERDRHDEAARKERDALRRIEREILGAFRNEERNRSRSAKQPSTAASDPTHAAAPPGSDSPIIPAEAVRTPPADVLPPLSDSTDQPFATPEQKLRTPPVPIQTPPKAARPKPPAINEEPGRPLNTLTPKGRCSSSSAVRFTPRESGTTTNFPPVGPRNLNPVTDPEPEKPPSEMSKLETNVRQAMERYCGRVDADAVGNLIASCRECVPDATSEEMVHFIEQKGTLILKRSKAGNPFDNPLGLLLTAVPKCFDGDFQPWRHSIVEANRARAIKVARIFADQLQRTRNNAIELLKMDPTDPLVAELRPEALATARAMLQDPSVDEENRGMVRNLVGGVGGP